VIFDLAAEMLDSCGALPDPVVRRGDPVTDSQWDADLGSCPGATFFHGSSWARVLQGAYGFMPVYLVLRDSGRIQALLPLMEVDSWMTGRRGVSLPFTDECAPLCADAGAFKALYQEALNYAKLRRWRYLECRGGLSLFKGALPSVSYLGHRLDLTVGEGSMLAQFDSSVRRAIRRSEQSGLTIEFSSDLGAVRDFYGLLCKTRRRHGVPPQPFNFFSAIHEHILSQGQGWVVLARLGRVPVAGAIYFHFGKVAIYKFGASDEAFQQLRANNLVMWKAIKHYAREGFEVLDFGRTSLTNIGLQKFKLSWGAVEHRIEYIRHDLRTGGFAVAGDAASGWHTRLLGMVPDPVFKLLGSILYKHIA
jgi:CelD/BcsL family acetyltransferase involved in cellulose biosynthesis